MLIPVGCRFAGNKLDSTSMNSFRASSIASDQHRTILLATGGGGLRKDAGRAGMGALASSPLHGEPCLLLTHPEPSEIKQWQCRAYSTKPLSSISKHTLPPYRFFSAEQSTQSAWPPTLIDFTLPLCLRSDTLSCPSIYILHRRHALQQRSNRHLQTTP